MHADILQQYKQIQVDRSRIVQLWSYDYQNILVANHFISFHHLKVTEHANQDDMLVISGQIFTHKIGERTINKNISINIAKKNQFIFFLCFRGYSNLLAPCSCSNQNPVFICEHNHYFIFCILAFLFYPLLMGHHTSYQFGKLVIIIYFDSVYK